MAEPKAELRCKVRYRGHEHGSGCWGMSDQLTHHRMVYAEGRDFQCTCGVWGAAEPGYMGYQWHLESLIEDMAKAMRAVTPEAINEDLPSAITSEDPRAAIDRLKAIGDRWDRLRALLA